MLRLFTFKGHQLNNQVWSTE